MLGEFPGRPSRRNMPLLPAQEAHCGMPPTCKFAASTAPRAPAGTSSAVAAPATATDTAAWLSGLLEGDDLPSSDADYAVPNDYDWRNVGLDRDGRVAAVADDRGGAEAPEKHGLDAQRSKFGVDTRRPEIVRDGSAYLEKAAERSEARRDRAEARRSYGDHPGRQSRLLGSRQSSAGSAGAPSQAPADSLGPAALTHACSGTGESEVSVLGEDTTMKAAGGLRRLDTTRIDKFLLG